MSAPSSTISSERIDPGYLRSVALAVLLMFALFLAFTWIIDPYGVSPLRASLPRVNVLKPKRLDIDRLIKPLEVWRDQPRTVLLGTSRIHQSIDPSGLDGTRLAPAYNASIPASTLNENANHLERFFALDKRLRVVFVELFIYNFVNPAPPDQPSQSFIEGGASLFLSAGAAFGSVQTLAFNLFGRGNSAQVARGGFWVPPAEFRTSFGQTAFIDETMKMHRRLPPLAIQEAAFAALDRIVDICRRNDAELHLIITPGYPWDDYGLLSMGYWPVLEIWLRRVSSYENVISFSQYNALLEEPPAPIMEYWNDPIHFNLAMGRKMLAALRGAPEPDTPANFMRRVTPDTVEAVIRERRSGLDDWVRRNGAFTRAFDRARDERFPSTRAR